MLIYSPCSLKPSPPLYLLIASPSRLCSTGRTGGYDEINLNVGCPSDRVQNGMFGACLMGNAQLVADCVKAMRDVVSIPVTVKTRIGIDDQDSYAFLCDFIDTVSGQGECEMFIIHARKAWLSGLSPKENREIPPLDYPRVYQLKRDFPHLTMSINGGIKSLEEAKEHLRHMDGVMVGREAYQNPGILAAVDREIFGADTTDADPVAGTGAGAKTGGRQALKVRQKLVNLTTPCAVLQGVFLIYQ